MYRLKNTKNRYRLSEIYRNVIQENGLGEVVRDDLHDNRRVQLRDEEYSGYYLADALERKLLDEDSGSRWVRR